MKNKFFNLLILSLLLVSFTGLANAQTDTIKTISGFARPTIGELNENIVRAFTLTETTYFNFVNDGEGFRIRMNDANQDLQEVEILFEPYNKIIIIKDKESLNVDINNDNLLDLKISVDTITTTAARVNLWKLKEEDIKEVEPIIIEEVEEPALEPEVIVEEESEFDILDAISIENIKSSNYAWLYILVSLFVVGIFIMFVYHRRKK